MIVTLSEPRFAALIRSLEPATANDTDEEILERIQTYAAKLFRHIANFGLQMTGLINQRKGIADFRFTLTDEKEYRQGDPRSVYIDGLNLLNPVCVTVELTDLSALVLNPTVAPVMKDHWEAIKDHLVKILPNEIIPKLEEAASAIVFQGAQAEAEEGIPAELGYDAWAIANGIPLHDSHIRRERARAAEIEARQSANDRRSEQRERESESNMYLREF